MPIAAIKTAGAYLIQADHLNTPRAILGASNALVWKWDSDAFGGTAANENPSALGIFNYNPRFPGQYYDKESALHYNYFRDSYNPKTGRYFQSDPIGLLGGINTYAYVGNNPVGYRDPLGLNPFAGAIGGAEIGSAFGPIGTVVGGVVGLVGGYAIADKLNNLIFNRPPGAIDAEAGAKAWGRKNDAGGKDAVDIFHRIKGGNKGKPGSKPKDNCSVNPDSGDVFDGQGDYIGNLGEGH